MALDELVVMLKMMEISCYYHNDRNSIFIYSKNSLRDIKDFVDNYLPDFYFDPIISIHNAIITKR